MMKRQAHPVLTRLRAEQEGHVVSPWQSVQVGEWAITDDGYAAPCLSRKTYTDSRGHSRDFVRLSFASYWLPTSRGLRYRDYEATGIWGRTSTRSWSEREARQQRTKHAVMVYVQMVLAGRVHWHILGALYRPDQAIPAATVKRLFRMEVVTKMVREELRRVLESRGITEGEVIGMLMQTFAAAEKAGKPADMRNVTNDLAAMLDMKSLERSPFDVRTPYGALSGRVFSPPRLPRMEVPDEDDSEEELDEDDTAYDGGPDIDDRTRFGPYPVIPRSDAL